MMGRVSAGLGAGAHMLGGGTGLARPRLFHSLSLPQNLFLAHEGEPCQRALEAALRFPADASQRIKLSIFGSVVAPARAPARPRLTTTGWQAPLAVALQTTSRSVVKCCGWLGNSCGHGCGYDLAAVVMMYGVVSSRLP